VGAAIYRENLTIGISLKVIGAGANTTIIDGGGANSVFTVSPTTKATILLSGLTIRHGVAPAGGGIQSTNSTLTIQNCIVTGNLAASSCIIGRVCPAGSGGGIASQGRLTINKSTINGNAASQGYPCGTKGCPPSHGGGIVHAGTLIINNSTVSGNSVEGDPISPFAFPSGGGIDSPGSGGAMTINNSTISGNSAPHGRGGGVFIDFGTATIQNSIVANNSEGGNCSGWASMTSHGYNLSSDSTCHFNGPGDLNNITDPKLGTLGNYGGPTQTIPLLSGSPAIDAGNPSGCTDGLGHLLTTDQRGMPRPDKPEDTTGCDMGAYERQSD